MCDLVGWLVNTKAWKGIRGKSSLDGFISIQLPEEPKETIQLVEWRNLALSSSI